MTNIRKIVKSVITMIYINYRDNDFDGNAVITSKDKKNNSR